MSAIQPAKQFLAASISTPAAASFSGGTAAQLTATHTPAQAGIMVQAALGNTDTIRVGDANVTTTRGIELGPGDSWFFPLNDAALLYGIVVSGTQKINWAVL